MSSQPITSGSFTNPNGGYSLSSLTNNSQLQVTGLASGLNTNAIIQALVAIDQQPINNLTAQQNGLTATNQQLTSIQTALQQLVANAQALSSPKLFANSQTVASTNPTLVSATATSGSGAVVGGYQVAVSALATAAQRTYTFTPQSSADTVTINGQQVSLAANAHGQDLVNAVNSASNLDVWATVTSTNTIVFSSRSTGQLPSNFISISDTADALQQQGTGMNGQNAQYTIDGVAGSSPSDTFSASTAGVTGATIPGVTLTLNGTTGTSGPVGVTVSPPGPNTQSIQTAVQTFISAYNSVLSQIQNQLSQTPVKGQPTAGTLYGDPALQGLITSMREAMDATAGGLPQGATITSMLSIGVSTGAARGNAAPSQSSINGQLTLDTASLTSALQSNPYGVLQMLQSWSQSFTTIVNPQAAPGGAISSRLNADSSQISALGNQIEAMQVALNEKQNQLQRQFAAMEAALSQNQSTSAWLTSQINALPTP
jgi:flagellar hook-associated protein 2